MMKLFEAAELYMKRCKWQDMALLKLCLLALGIMIGMCLSKKSKRVFFVVAPTVFGFTLVPLVRKFMETVKEVMEA